MPMFRLSSSPSSSACSVIRSAVRHRISPRRAEVSRIHRSSVNAVRAAATAASTSVFFPRATSAITSAVPGSYVGNTSPAAAGTQLPSINRRTDGRSVRPVTELCTVIVIVFSSYFGPGSPGMRSQPGRHPRPGSAPQSGSANCADGFLAEDPVLRGVTRADVVICGRHGPQSTGEPHSAADTAPGRPKATCGSATGTVNPGAGVAPASTLCASVGTSADRHIANPLLSYMRTAERNEERLNSSQSQVLTSTAVPGGLRGAVRSNDPPREAWWVPQAVGIS